MTPRVVFQFLVAIIISFLIGRIVDTFNFTDNRVVSFIVTFVISVCLIAFLLYEGIL